MYIVVMTTTEKKEDAERIAKSTVEKNLSACSQVIGPMRSFYRWKEKIECAEEYLIIMKTRAENYKELENHIKKSHPYSVPEIVAVPVQGGFEGYLKWIDDNVL